MLPMDMAEAREVMALTTYRYGAARRVRSRPARPGPTTCMVVSVDCSRAVASDTWVGPTIRGTNADWAVSENTADTLIRAATTISWVTVSQPPV